MKKFLMAIAGASILVLGACGGGGDEAPAEDTPTEDPADAETETPAAEDAEGEDAEAEDAEGEDATEGDAEGDATADAGTYDAAAAEDLYKKSCASCHGQDLEGGSIGPALTGMGKSAEEIEAIILEGVEGTAMAPGMAKGEDATLLAQWLADK